MKKVELRTMEQIKYEIIKNLVDNDGNKHRAAIKLGITIRQVNRLIQIYRTYGKAGFVHGNRGRLPKKVISQDIKNKILELYKSKYFDANFKHFQELLEERENIKISYSSVYQILTEYGIKSKKKHKDRKTHRQRKIIFELFNKISTI